MTLQEIQNITAKVICDDKQGTGFYINSNLILTAYHVVMNNDEIVIIDNNGNSQNASLWAFDRELDIALLKIQSLKEHTCILFFPYLDTTKNSNIWGYIATGIQIEGRITPTQDIFTFNVTAGIRASYKGLSGSAVCIDGMIAGIAKTQYGDAIINAISTKSILRFLVANDIKIDFQIPFKVGLDTNIKDLGTRYSPELDVKLPIAKIFDGLARNGLFFKRTQKVFEECLNSLRECRFSTDDEIFELLNSFKEGLHNHYFNSNWKKAICAKDWLNIASPCYDNLNEYSNILFNQYLEQKNEEERKKNDYKRDRVRKSTRAIYDLIQYIESPLFQLAEHKCLLLKGDAGTGKSHLLADIAANRMKEGLCSILILGNKLINHDIWQQIMLQANFTEGKERFLTYLDHIGSQQGANVLILVDALNEGEGKSFWTKHLSGFINEIKNYDYISLALSVRTSYWSEIVPETVEKDDTIIKSEHKGFRGNEYEAISKYCAYFGLEQPRVPLLSPEFSNPLTLYLLCSSLKQNGEKYLPEGSNGIMLIYETYIASLNKKLAHSDHLGYDSSINLVQKALLKLAEYSAENNSSKVPFEVAIELLNTFKAYYTSNKPLLYALIDENIISKEIYYKWDEDDNYVSYDGIRFSFERFSDHIITKFLLKKHIDKSNIFASFQEGGFFYTFLKIDAIINQNHLLNSGIIEALAIQLPEKYGIEIVEAFPIPISEEYDKIRYYDGMVHAFVESLRWRTIESIDIEKVYSLLDNETVQLLFYENNFHVLRLELTTNPRHPLNGDSLHDLLINIPMAERDSFWLQFISGYFGYGDDENPLIVKRLIDWAWRKNAHDHYTDESIRLAAQTITWFLCSQNKTLRDSATKALICLFEDRPLVTIQVLQAFEKVDDMYISERLYAAAYGCAIRLSNAAEVKPLAQYVYDTIFKNGNPPRHILWRDYARNIIEYALHLKIDIDIADVRNIRPPYNSPMLEIPSDEAVKKFEKNRNDPEYNKTYHSAQNAIHFEVLEWDFKNKTIAPKLDDFHNVSFTGEKRFTEFSKELKGTTKKGLMTLLKMADVYSDYSSKPDAIFHTIYVNIKSMISSKLTKKQHLIFKNEIEPHLEAIKNQKNQENQLHNVAKWILNRVFELGWSLELHGEFDSRIKQRNYTQKQDIESIGEKYQWIALHEALAVIADNYYFLPNGRWNSQVKDYYQGTWQLYIQDIDPTTIVKIEEKSADEPKKLWNNVPYANWNTDISSWLNDREDIPNPTKFLFHKDTEGMEWICLEITFLDWQEPRQLVEDEYEGSKRTIWQQVRSYFVKKQEDTVNWLEKQIFMGRWMPEATSYYKLYSREYYWSSAYIDEQYEWNDKNKKVKKPLERFFDGKEQYKGIPTTINHNFESDDLSKHYSLIPCHLLFNQLSLRYGREDGTFVNENNEIVCFDPSLKFDNTNSLWIHVENLVAFLKKTKLELVWTLLGEKQHRKAHREYEITEFSGTYVFDKNEVKIKGQINYFYNRQT
jgi:Trypsin-like peptidase domain